MAISDLFQMLSSSASSPGFTTTQLQAQMGFQVFLLRRYGDSLGSIVKETWLQFVPCAWMEFTKESAPGTSQYASMYFMHDVLIFGWLEDSLVQLAVLHSKWNPFGCCMVVSKFGIGRSTANHYSLHS